MLLWPEAVEDMVLNLGGAELPDVSGQVLVAFELLRRFAERGPKVSLELLER
jgi:hypothetical protein